MCHASHDIVKLRQDLTAVLLTQQAREVPVGFQLTQLLCKGVEGKPVYGRRYPNQRYEASEIAATTGAACPEPPPPSIIRPKA